MNKRLKYLLYTTLLFFTILMVIIHEPKSVLPDPVQGVVRGSVSEGVVPVKLANGEKITVEAPRQLPRLEGLKVSLEITDYQWSGKREYTIISWKSR